MEQQITMKTEEEKNSNSLSDKTFKTKQAHKEAFRLELKTIMDMKDFHNNLQNIHTPYSLCCEQIDKLERYTSLLEKDFLVFNLEYIEVLLYDFGIKRDRIFFVTDCKEKKAITKHERYNGIHVKMVNFKKGIEKMKLPKKFDVVIMNPPYQTKNDINDTKTQPLWHKFVSKIIDYVKNDGYLVSIHPSGWRNVAGVFKETQNLLKSKFIKYLKFHSFRDGQLIFDVAINFDYYILQNTNNNNFLTHILFEDKEERQIDISKLEFIPSENFDEVMSLVAKNIEERVKIIRDASNFHTQHTNMSKEQTNKFKYPCIYTIKSPDNDNKPTFWYSSTTKDCAYFGVPKVIFANGASGVFIDKNGEYGLTQFAYAIVDKPNNLENIKKALQSERFIRKIMGFKSSLGDKYNRKIISTFKKDFWKEFI